jgi:transposase
MFTSVVDPERLRLLSTVLTEAKLHVAEIIYLHGSKPWPYERDAHLVTFLAVIIGVIIVHEERKGIALDTSADDSSKGIGNFFKIKLRGVSKTFQVIFFTIL